MTPRVPKGGVGAGRLSEARLAATSPCTVLGGGKHLRPLSRPSHSPLSPGPHMVGSGGVGWRGLASRSA